MTSGGLKQKRILVTDIESDFGSEIANALYAEEALVFVLVKECRGMQQVLNQTPYLTPVLLDFGKPKCEEQARKLMLSLPSVDHFINLSGDAALNIISQTNPNAKIHEITDIKTKPVISKMIEATSGRCYIFNVSFGNQNIMSKLKANLDPRYTNSKTAQISTNLRLSFKKMFSSGNDNETPTQNPAAKPISQTTNQSDHAVVRESTTATSFAAVATSLSNRNGDASASNPTSRPSPSNSRLQSLQEKNTKIKHSILKLQKSCAKKWKSTEQKIAKEQKTALKTLQKDVEKSKKMEKATIMKQISDANASTASRSQSLSADTANRILEARESRADREVEKHAQKKLENETEKLLESRNTRITESHDKLYKKMVDKQINEFNRIKSKYLI